MERFDQATTAFEHAIERARQMVNLYDALTTLRGTNSLNDDALRSACIQAVSSFDFFAHELAAIEAKHRFNSKLLTRKISLSMNVMALDDHEERCTAADLEIRQSNGYKAFVDPGKLAELLSCYTQDPWKRIAELINFTRAKGDQRTPEDLKSQLRLIWMRRNKIAHEADINPTLSGIGLWPIDKRDIIFMIDFLAELGKCLPTVISEPMEKLEEEISEHLNNGTP